MDQISFDEFSKVEIKIGTIVAAEKVAGADRLLKLTVEFGNVPVIPNASEGSNALDPSASLRMTEGMDSRLRGNDSEIRTIVSGIAQHYLPEQIIGKQVPVVMNLAPRIIKGIESQGMVLFAIDETPIDGAATRKTVMLHPEKEVPPGSPVQ